MNAHHTLESRKAMSKTSSKTSTKAATKADTITIDGTQYALDNLSENVKRGLRTKVKRGEMPGVAPIGYINNKNTKRIVLDRRVAPKITKAFELYAQGDKTMSEDQVMQMLG